MILLGCPLLAVLLGVTHSQRKHRFLLEVSVEVDLCVIHSASYNRLWVPISSAIRCDMHSQRKHMLYRLLLEVSVKVDLYV